MTINESMYFSGVGKHDKGGGVFIYLFIAGVHSDLELIIPNYKCLENSTFKVQLLMKKTLFMFR